MIEKLFFKSFIGKWFLKPEKEIDVFKSSKVVKSIESSEKIVNKQTSFFYELILSLKKEFLARPVFVLSLVVLSATVMNSLLDEFNLLRLALIILCVFGLFVNVNFNDLKKSSFFLKIKSSPKQKS